MSEVYSSLPWWVFEPPPTVEELPDPEREQCWEGDTRLCKGKRYEFHNGEWFLVDQGRVL